MKKMFVIFVLLILMAAYVAATGYTADQPSHTTLYVDELRGKTADTVSVNDVLCLNGDCIGTWPTGTVLPTCIDGQVVKYDSVSGTWICGDDTGGAGSGLIIESGIVPHGGTIPLPAGVTDESQCKWIVAAANHGAGIDYRTSTHCWSSPAVSTDFNPPPDVGQGRVVTCFSHNSINGLQIRYGSAQYLIICGEGAGAALPTCADGQVLKYDMDTSSWVCAEDEGGAGGGFGTIEARSPDTIYQAATDGFVVATFQVPTTQNSNLFVIGYADSNSNPTTIRAREAGTYVQNSAWNYHGSITMPVKAGEYWKVVGNVQPSELTASSIIYWVPLIGGAGGGADTDWIISGSDMYSGVTGNVGVGTSTPTQKLDVRGPIRNKYDGTNYDLWLQGGASTASGDDRNLAILGVNEESGDTLYINYAGEYAGGTVLGGKVCIGGVCKNDWSGVQGIAEGHSTGGFPLTTVAALGIGGGYYRNSVVLDANRPVLGMRVYGASSYGGSYCLAFVPNYFSLGVNNYGTFPWTFMTTTGSHSGQQYGSALYDLNYDSGIHYIVGGTYGFVQSAGGGGNGDAVSLHRPLGVSYIPAGSRLYWDQWSVYGTTCYVQVIYGNYR
ncbi:hypothetical protein KY337_03940 [Candidatus Woesearchaeota archaeon]|nr:hypothetical protein [Candidatus Woesearchaeota archaeon]